MVSFKALLRKFGKKGEKTGWICVEIPAHIANELNPGVRMLYRVKGKLDGHFIKPVALFSMGDGDFVIPVNAEMRRGIRKKEGEIIVA